MSAQLNLRCVLALLAAMATSVAAGLLAWGPISPGTHRFADTRTLAGVDNAVNVLASLLPVLASAAGAAALRHARWPSEIARPWQLFFLAGGGASLLGAVYHLRADDTAFVMAHLLLTIAYTALLAGFLAERVHRGFGSRSACVLALLMPIGATLYYALAEAAFGVADMRALLLLQLLPVLLVPAGALGLPGRGVTSGGDWLALLSLYALARLCEAADAGILAISGFVSGHSLMHLLLGAATAVVAYRALAAAPLRTPSDASDDASSQRITSASTAAS